MTLQTLHYVNALRNLTLIYSYSRKTYLFVETCIFIDVILRDLKSRDFYIS